MTFFKTNDNVRLNYQLQGPYDGPVIVFSTGYSGDQATWNMQIPYFLEKGYRILTWDYRAHGHSDQVDYGLRIARLASDLNELLTQLHLDQVILVGHSMGTMVHYAYVSLFGQKRIRAIVSEDQPPKMLTDENWFYGRYDLTYANLEQMAEDFPKTPLIRKQISDDVKRAISDSHPKFDFKATRPLIVDGMEQDFTDVVRIETCPHLFIAGGKSPLYDAHQAEAARSLHQNALSQAVVLDECGHIPHLEDVEKFNRTLEAFFITVRASEEE
ncbi:alpha/beta hydrolase [Weissella minor]|uniref:alpha/beta fold hydrolase n=1 Tax=Weissella minor TaxID=1620 RepID=UPI001BAFE873|nr:alpha/beta hydrolase [Weissella minor]MBS0950139.1 alpha/beta hydrolase [Weissella minor]